MMSIALWGWCGNSEERSWICLANNGLTTSVAVCWQLSGEPKLLGPVCIRVDCQPYPRVDMDPGVIPEEFLSQSPPLIISQTLLKIRRMSQCVHLEPIFHVRCHVRGYSDDTPPNVVVPRLPDVGVPWAHTHDTYISLHWSSGNSAVSRPRWYFIRTPLRDSLVQQW